MFGRVFLLIITAISLIWLGYSTFDRVNQSKSFKVEYLFGKADKELLIIKNVAQAPIILEQFDRPSSAIDSILTQINADFIQCIYVSKTRDHLLITAKDAITTKNIHSVFLQSKVEQVKKGTFKIEQFEGSFSNNAIYITAKNISLNKDPWQEFQFDRNADASVIQFDKEIPSIIDVYIKQHGVIEYKTSLLEQVTGTKVNDRVAFSNVIPASISSYEFYETDYLRFREPTILESPINNWLKYGLVKVIINGHEALITDYIEGQDPIQVLYDFYQLESKDADNEFFKGKTLTSLLASSGGFYIFQLDDYVVISANRVTCETIIADYKLGNTLAQQPEKAATIFSSLPQKVNYRKYSKVEKHTASVYDRQLLTTFVNSTSQETSKPTQNVGSGPASFVVGTVKDIYLLSEKSFFVSTTDNKILFFEEDKKKWETMLDDAVIGQPEIIDILANGKSQLMVATAKKVHVFDINGNDVNGFPIALDEQVNVVAPAFYRWKGNGFFVISGEKGRLIQYDNQGRELNVIRTQLNAFDRQPIIWTSANKPFIGVQGADKFEMIQLDTRKSLRSFNVANAELALKLPNEIKLYGIHHKVFVSYDQRGGLSKFESTNGKIYPTINPDKGIVVTNLPFISLYNSAGLQWGNIKLPFNDLADVQVFTTASGATFIATIDGLENKVFLYKSNGELFSKQQFDGSKLVRFSGNSLFTVIDNLVVRYQVK